jgi:hypothetical protein
MLIETFGRQGNYICKVLSKGSGKTKHTRGRKKDIANVIRCRHLGNLGKR